LGGRFYDNENVLAIGERLQSDPPAMGDDVGSNFSESIVEDAALGWLEALGDAVLHGLAIVAGKVVAELSSGSSL
jgi:hypothetical protein